MNTPEMPKWLVKAILAKPIVKDECLRDGEQSKFLRTLLLADEEPDVPVQCELHRLHVGADWMLVDQTCRMSADRSFILHSQVTHAPNRLERSVTQTIRGLRDPIGQTKSKVVAEWIGPCTAPRVLETTASP